MGGCRSGNPGPKWPRAPRGWNELVVDGLRRRLRHLGGDDVLDGIRREVHQRKLVRHIQLNEHREDARLQPVTDDRVDDAASGDDAGERDITERELGALVQLGVAIFCQTRGTLEHQFDGDARAERHQTARHCPSTLVKDFGIQAGLDETRLQLGLLRATEHRQQDVNGIHEVMVHALGDFGRLHQHLSGASAVLTCPNLLTIHGDVHGGSLHRIFVHSSSKCIKHSVSHDIFLKNSVRLAYCYILNTFYVLSSRGGRHSSRPPLEANSELVARDVFAKCHSRRTGGFDCFTQKLVIPTPVTTFR